MPSLVEDMADEVLRSWAERRLSSVTDIVTTKWRGERPWEKPYDAVLSDWEAREHYARPPAFQDGRARPEQLLPGTPGAGGSVWAATADKSGKRGDPVVDTSWRYWLVRSGRGFGKTLCGAEAVVEWARQGLSPLLIAGPTQDDTRAFMVEEGESSILRIAPLDFMPEFQPSKRRLVFPNGVICAVRSADRPERFRGPQFVRAWFDELAAWRYLNEAWDQVGYVMRVKRAGAPVQVVITTTPKPVKLIRELSKHPRCALTVRSSYDNLANLADEFREKIEEAKGTRLGRQEVDAEIIDEVEGALWTLQQIEDHRWARELPALDRLVVAVDPPGGATEAGIIAAGRTRTCPFGKAGCRGHAFVLDDVSLRGAPAAWGAAAASVYHSRSADRIIGEVNYGGDMVVHVIQTVDPKLPVKVIRATRGKQVRAEPVSSLYEGDHPRVHHVGTFGDLENELTTWTDEADWSPNRLDALVWAIHELMLSGTDIPLIAPQGAERSSPWRNGR